MNYFVVRVKASNPGQQSGPRSSIHLFRPVVSQWQIKLASHLPDFSHFLLAIRNTLTHLGWELFYPAEAMTTPEHINDSPIHIDIWRRSYGVVRSCGTCFNNLFFCPQNQYLNL